MIWRTPQEAASPGQEMGRLDAVAVQDGVEDRRDVAAGREGADVVEDHLHRGPVAHVLHLGGRARVDRDAQLAQAAPREPLGDLPREEHPVRVDDRLADPAIEAGPDHPRKVGVDQRLPLSGEPDGADRPEGCRSRGRSRRTTCRPSSGSFIRVQVRQKRLQRFVTSICALVGADVAPDRAAARPDDPVMDAAAGPLGDHAEIPFLSGIGAEDLSHPADHVLDVRVGQLRREGDRDRPLGDELRVREVPRARSRTSRGSTDGGGPPCSGPRSRCSPPAAPRGPDPSRR